MAQKRVKIVFDERKFRNIALAKFEKGALKAGQAILKNAINSMPYDVDPSRPGDPPYSKTGKLKSSGKLVKLVHGLKVTFTAGYSMFLEIGTRKMAARPFLVPAAIKANILRFFK